MKHSSETGLLTAKLRSKKLLLEKATSTRRSSFTFEPTKSFFIDLLNLTINNYLFDVQTQVLR